MDEWEAVITVAGVGSVRRSRRDRRCDECPARIARGGQYYATNEDCGPHAWGYRYLCLACATRAGYIAEVIR